MEKQKKDYKIAMIVVITIFITFLLTTSSIFLIFLNGKRIGKYIFVGTSEETGSIQAELDKFKTVIDKYYLGEVNEEKLKEGAIKGYIEGLEDPYTEYIPKKEFTEYIESTKGTFIGIGVYMTKDETQNRIKIISVIADSPAEKCGVKEGDLIKSVDGVEYTADDMNTISSKIKGDENTTVKLEVIRNGETISLEIKREKVILNKIEEKIIDNKIGYMKITSFDENTSKDFKEKYEAFKSKNITSLIIDLRNNGGGIVSEALKIADFIVDKGSPLLYEVDKNGKEELKKSENDPIVDVPVVVLVNKNTASSSEILAGALKDLQKAKIVGTTTFGKGVIQQIITMTDGSGIKITTEEYQTPNKNKIHKKGIEPDETVKLPDTVKSELLVKEEDDTQLKKAIEMLK